MDLVTLGMGLGWSHVCLDDDACERPEPRGSRGSGVAAGPQLDGLPPGVLRGVKRAEGEETRPEAPQTREFVGPDWIRVTGGGELEEAAIAWAKGHWGDEFGDQPGFMFYEGCRTWPGGAKVLTGHTGGDSVMVQLSGSTLEPFDAAGRLQLLAELLELGFKATRIDLAEDFRGADVSLVDDVVASCQRGELCGARSWKPRPEYGSRGELARWEIDLGGRGSDGSGRFVRVYDKGLQTGTLPIGQWARWETEFTGDCADQVARALVLAFVHGTSDWVEEAAAMMYGSVDFRIGEKVRRLKDRARAGWWMEFLAGARTVRVKSKPVLRTLEGLKLWCRKSIAPTLHAMAEAAGMSVHAVMREMLASVDVNRDAVERALLRPTVHQYALSVQARRRIT